MENSESNIKEEKLKINKMKYNLRLKKMKLLCNILLLSIITFKAKSQCTTTWTMGQSAPLTWSVIPTYPLGTSSVFWNWGDGNSSTGMYPSHTYTASGTYSICVGVYSSVLSCSAVTCDTSYIYRSTQSFESNAMIQINILNPLTLGVNEASLSQSNSFFPNPSTGKITLKYKNTIGVIEVFNVLGEKLMESYSEKSGTTDLDLQNYNNGIYFIQFSDGNIKTREKLILNK